MSADGRNRRSIWRETKFLVKIIFNNLLDLEVVLLHFVDIASRLFVEKRKNGRLMQLVQP